MTTHSSTQPQQRYSGIDENCNVVIVLTKVKYSACGYVWVLKKLATNLIASRLLEWQPTADRNQQLLVLGFF